LTALLVIAVIIVLATLMYYAPDLIGWLLAIACGVVAVVILAPLAIALLIPMSVFGLMLAVLAVVALAIGALLLWPLLYLS
ncbi:MAG: hypothetical protein U1F05_15460, partial [Burkholderiales bacterium]